MRSSQTRFHRHLLMLAAWLLGVVSITDTANAHKLDPARIDLRTEEGRTVGSLHIPRGWESVPTLAAESGCSLNGPMIRCEPNAVAFTLEGIRADQQVFVFGGDGALLGSLSVQSDTFRLHENTSFVASIWLGVVHVLIGWDHVAFLLLLLLWVSTLSDRVVAISAFTIGHSVTLGAVAFGFAPWSSGATELLIAVSVLLLASETWIGQGRATPTKARLALLVGGVGLIHGLGFGGVLLELGSTRGGAVKTLFGFNIGIELGQLALFAVWTILEISVGRRAERGWAAFRRTVNLTAGILGAFWTIDRTMGWLQELL